MDISIADLNAKLAKRQAGPCSPNRPLSSSTSSSSSFSSQTRPSVTVQPFYHRLLQVLASSSSSQSAVSSSIHHYLWARFCLSPFVRDFDLMLYVDNSAKREFAVLEHASEFGPPQTLSSLHISASELQQLCCKVLPHSQELLLSLARLHAVDAHSDFLVRNAILEDAANDIMPLGCFFVSTSQDWMLLDAMRGFFSLDRGTRVSCNPIDASSNYIVSVTYSAAAQAYFCVTKDAKLVQLDSGLNNVTVLTESLPFSLEQSEGMEVATVLKCVFLQDVVYVLLSTGAMHMYFVQHASWSTSDEFGDIVDIVADEAGGQILVCSTETCYLWSPLHSRSIGLWDDSEAHFAAVALYSTLPFSIVLLDAQSRHLTRIVLHLDRTRGLASLISKQHVLTLPPSYPLGRALVLASNYPSPHPQLCICAPRSRPLFISPSTRPRHAKIHSRRVEEVSHKGSGVSLSPSGVPCPVSDRVSYFVCRDTHCLYAADIESGSAIVVAGRPGIPGHEDGPLDFCLFDSPSDVCYDAQSGFLYIADTGNHCIRSVHLETRQAATVAGGGSDLELDGTFGGCSFFGPIRVSLMGRKLMVLTHTPGALRILDLDARTCTSVQMKTAAN